MTKVLIAAVATAVVVNGERVVIPAGEPLPQAVSAHDADALLASGAAVDEKAAAAHTKAEERLADEAAAAFEAAKANAVAAQASIAGSDSTAPATAKAAKKGA